MIRARNPDPGDLQRGYHAGLAREPLAAGASPAFEHGRLCAVNDLRDGKPGDLLQRMLARDVMTPPWVRDALSGGADVE